MARWVGELDVSSRNSALGEADSLLRKPRGVQHLDLVASTNRPVYGCVGDAR